MEYMYLFLKILNLTTTPVHVANTTIIVLYPIVVFSLTQKKHQTNDVFTYTMW